MSSSALTLFACPKSFQGFIGLIQRNAITSWTRLKPRPEIILFGNEVGIATLCQELKLRHIPEVTKSEFGIPLVSDIFEKAEKAASHSTLGYVNADIILMSDFLRAIDTIRKWNNNCLTVGSRTGVDLKDPLDFEELDWEEKLRTFAVQKGHPMTVSSDYFVFSRGLFQQIPAFAIGRAVWDNWLLWNARHRAVPVVDATPLALVVHQEHPPTIHLDDPHRLEEIQYNRTLAGFWPSSFVLRDATHQLVPQGIRRMLYRSFANRVQVLVKLTVNRARAFLRPYFR